MELLFGIILGLFILVFLVVVHELGHAIVARRNGVVVEEFGIGFPPRAWKKKLKNGILFTLNWLPLGGFVKLQGEHDAANKKGDYGAASFWQKTKILLAGVGVNWIVAAGLFTILAWTGMPKILPDQFSVANDVSVSRQPVEIVTLEEGYPAEQAGLEAGDTIIRFAGESVPTTERLVELSKQHKGERVDIIYTRDGVESTKEVTLRDSKEGGVFGAGLSQQEILHSTWSAPIVGVGTTAQFTWVTLSELGKLLVNVAVGFVQQFSPNEEARTSAKETLNQAGQSVAGPIGILGVIFPAAGQAGFTEVVFLTAIISLTLAVMNTLPIPALDGGRWFVTAIFHGLKIPLTKKREEQIQSTGFMVLMGLVIVVTITDVSKLF